MQNYKNSDLIVAQSPGGIQHGFVKKDSAAVCITSVNMGQILYKNNDRNASFAFVYIHKKNGKIKYTISIEKY
jgi:hypothetical protein